MNRACATNPPRVSALEVCALDLRALRRRALLAGVLVASAAASHEARAAQTTVEPSPDAPPVFEPATALEAVLPQSSVYDILEDTDGFLWFATREGVARWDGRVVRAWRHDPFDEASLPGNVVRQLTQDASGDIWLTAADYLELPAGVARIRAPRFTEVERYDLPRAAIGLDTEGRPIAVTPDSVLTFDPVGGRFVPWLARSLPDHPESDRRRPPYVMTSSSDELWISGVAGFERCRLTEAPECVVVAERTDGGGPLHEGLDGSVWVGVDRGIEWGFGGDEFGGDQPGETGPHLVDLSPAGPIASIVRDSAGVMWVLSESGVDRVIEGKWISRSPLPVIGDRNAIAPIVAHVDRAQNVWIGTVWGVFVHARARKPFLHLGHIPQDPTSLASALVSALEEDVDGSIWIGSIGGGLSHWDPRSGRIERFVYGPDDPASIPSDIIWDLERDEEGIIWVGTSNGLARPSGEGRFRTFLPDPADPRATLRPGRNTIQDLQIDSGGRLWAHCPSVCGDSLSYFDRSESRFTSLQVPGLGQAGYSGASPDGRLWVGSQNGISLVDPETETAERLGGVDDLDGALAFHLGSTGDMWVGSNSGLYRFDAEGELVERFTTDDGLPSNAVYGVLEDERRRLWMSTNRGLALLDLDEPEGQRIRAYDRTIGVENVEFNRNAYLEASNGVMYFGGDRGVTWFHPRDIADNGYAPRIVVTGLERLNEDGPEHEYLGGDLPAVLRPGDDTFAFEFAALSYINPHRNRFRVLLDGFEERWRELGTEARATYTNVPPGRYTFRVQGSNEDGVWGPEEARLDVVVEPWFWETLVFRLGALGLLAGAAAAVAVFVSRARYRTQLAQLRAEQALDRERARLSRDMHDEVGASLTEIAILSEVARADGAVGDRGRDRLARIGGKSRQALDSISGIIWAIDPTRDHASVGPYLREYASEVLESADLSATFEFPPTASMPELTADVRRTLRLVLKEALANVIRHAEAERVHVALSIEPGGSGTIRLRVSDDGRGLDPERVARQGAGHDGLRNMRERAEAAGGRFEVTSPAGGAGTRVEVVLPLGEVWVP